MGVPFRQNSGACLPVSAFCRYRVSLQRKKCCQQIVGRNDKSSSLVVCSRPFLCRLSAGSSTIRTRGSLLRATLGFSLCPEKKEADDAAYDSGPYK
jgi:hypothetical protein